MADDYGKVRTEERLKIKIGEAKNLQCRNHTSIQRDVYCTLSLDQEEIFRTSTIEKTLSPFFGEEFQFEVPRKFRYLSVYVYDRDRHLKQDKVLGKVAIKREDLSQYNNKDHWFSICPVDADSEVQGKANIKIAFDEIHVKKSSGFKTHLLVSVAECVDLTLKNGSCDPFAHITVIYSNGKKVSKRTKARKKTACPTFEEEFDFWNYDEREKDRDSAYTVCSDSNVEFSELHVSLWHDTPGMSGHVFLGEVRIPLREIQQQQKPSQTNAWYFLQPRSGKNKPNTCSTPPGTRLSIDNSLGSLRLQVQYTADHVFPAHVYDPLRSLLLDSINTKPITYSSVYLLGEIISNKADVAQPLVRIFMHQGQIVPMIRALAKAEIENLTDATTIFRGNTLVSKMMDEAMKLTGLQYLHKTLRPTIDLVFNERKPCEIDPARVSDPNVVQSNLANLTSYVQSIFQAITQSAVECPALMCQIFHNLKECAMMCFSNNKEVRYSVISGFIFLRFFAPAILGPRLFDMCSCTNFTFFFSHESTGSLANKRWMSQIRRIDKILIANRGEIACRVIRTARRLGVKTVAVYSDADEAALHVALADEAYNIGPPSASKSYLKGDKLLEVARRTNCQAVHPGYGFLSENVEFADDCQRNGVIFIGPPASAIRDMGIKSTSKAIMSAAGVPIIEGYHGEDQSDAKLKEEAKRIGFPIMIKAVRGGGGKGMRIALTEADFDEALQSARSESQKAFADSVVLLEKFVGEPRHVEVQVFADTHGNAVHLFERDCSVQRRHQKIIEEAPAPGLSSDLRSELGLAAVRAAKAVGYVGAGTVEFILDRRTHSFHFMEMNTRLQVEHPITEMITGTDLVEWQLKIASGEELPVKQEDIKLNGHAFEARIYAEDPRGGFLPGAGPLLYLQTPNPSEDIRIETGVRQGDEVSVHYDPMIAKLVVWGKDRTEALTKLNSKLLEYNIAGLETNVNFLLDLSAHPEFVAGNVHTNFIRDHNDSLFREEKLSEVQIVNAALAVVLTDEMAMLKSAISANDQYNPFVVESGFRVNHRYIRDIKLKHKENDLFVKVKYGDTNEYYVSVDNGKTWNFAKGDLTEDDNGNIKLNVNYHGAISKVNVFRNEDILAIFDQSGKYECNFEQPTYLHEEGDEQYGSTSKAVAPMPGVIEKILVKAGDTIKKGDSVFVLIAMKMEYIVKANRDAKVESILHQVGDNVAKDAVVVKFLEEESK